MPSEPPSYPSTTLTTRPGTDPAQAAAVWSSLVRLYEAYQKGDRAGLARALHPRATFFDSGLGGLVDGRAALERLHGEAGWEDGGEAADEASIEAGRAVVDIYGDIAVARYWLRIDLAPDGEGAPLTPELVRNTAVLRRVPGDHWRVVHLHEDVQQEGGAPQN